MTDAPPPAAPVPPPAPALPDWSPLPDSFHALRALCDQTGGFFRELPHHVLAYLPGRAAPEAGRLVVSWENLASPASVGDRMPWGHALVGRQGWAMLGVMVKRKYFFRDTALFDGLEALRDEGFFARFAQVSMYGSSMGGYGGLAFAGLAPGCTVVAFAPQSSLNRRIAPFEARYRYAARVFDWSGRYADAAEGLAHAGRAYLFYDPDVTEDRRHVERLLAADARGIAVPLAARWMTHKLPPTLLRLGILKEVALSALQDRLTPAEFHRAARVRMGNVGCIDRMLDAAQRRGHLWLALAAALAAQERSPNWKLRQRITGLEAALDLSRGAGLAALREARQNN